MTFKEEKGDLFAVDFKKYSPVHCISRDCKMGAGIAVPMKKKFNLGGLKQVIDDMPVPITSGICIYHNGVFNLITKKKYYHKPTYDTLKNSLISLVWHCHEKDIKNIVMPKIGSGLDQLQWPRVREIIQEVFQDIDVNILVRVR